MYVGFICPVHTPDGAPCGLLNHLSAFCKIVTETQDSSKIPSVLIGLGMAPIDDKCPYAIKDCYKVVLDGRILGYIPKTDGKKISDKLRMMKLDDKQVSWTFIQIENLNMLCTNLSNYELECN